MKFYVYGYKFENGKTESVYIGEENSYTKAFDVAETLYIKGVDVNIIANGKTIFTTEEH